MALIGTRIYSNGVTENINTATPAVPTKAFVDTDEGTRIFAVAYKAALDSGAPKEKAFNFAKMRVDEEEATRPATIDVATVEAQVKARWAAMTPSQRARGDYQQYLSNVLRSMRVELEGRARI